jgi:hypothetical protein
MTLKTKIMELEIKKEAERHFNKDDGGAYLQSSKLADKFASKLFKEKHIGVMQANSVYIDVQNIVYEAMLRTHKLRSK